MTLLMLDPRDMAIDLEYRAILRERARRMERAAWREYRKIPHWPTLMQRLADVDRLWNRIENFE